MAANAESRTFFVYGLTDPAEPEFIRYVGQTESMFRRMKEHLSGANSCCDVNFWIRGLAIFGRYPSCHLLQVVHGTRPDSRTAERTHIHRVGNSHGRILNQGWHRKLCEQHGINQHIQEAYFDGLRSVFIFARKTLRTDAYRNGFRKLCDSVDHLESGFPAMRLFTATDSFYGSLCLSSRSRRLHGIQPRVDRGIPQAVAS